MMKPEVDDDETGSEYETGSDYKTGSDEIPFSLINSAINSYKKLHVHYS